MTFWMTIGNIDDNLIDEIMDEIDFGSDRATAIVLAAFVEDHLTQFVRSRLTKDERLQERMFGPGAALGDFGLKINLGYLCGFYSTTCWKELDAIRRIRNDFAHNLTIGRFDIPTIKDRCNNLQQWETLKKVVRSASSEEDPDMANEYFSGDPADQKQRYVNACRFYIAMFTMAIRKEYTPPEPVF